MTPFGALLRHYRTLRGVSQKDLARRLNCDSKLISSLETGRHSAPKDAMLDALYEALALSACEREQLANAAGQSSFLIRLPRDTSPLDLALVHRLVTIVGSLDLKRKTQIQHLIGEEQCI
jgi:transcriptional regulator with XRE-family HTH domain